MNFQSDVVQSSRIPGGTKAILVSPSGLLIEIEAVQMSTSDLAVYEVALECGVPISFMLDNWEDVTIKVNG